MKNTFSAAAFAGRLLTCLEQREMSQSQLAAQLAVSRSTITGWLRYGKLPDADLLSRVCTVLGCSADWLLGLDNQREKQDEAGSLRWMEQLPPYLTPAQQEQITYGVRLFNEFIGENRAAEDRGRLALQAAFRAGAIRLTHVARHADLERQLQERYPILKEIIVAQMPHHYDDTIIRTEMVTFLAATQILGSVIRPGAVGLGSGYTMLRFCEQSVPSMDQFSGTRWVPLLAFQPDNLRDYTANTLARLMSLRHPGSQALYLPHPMENLPHLEADTRRAMSNMQMIFASVSGVDRRDRNGQAHLLAEFRSADYQAEAPELRDAYAHLADKKQFGAELLRYLLDTQGAILSHDPAVGAQVDLDILRYHSQVMGRVCLIAARAYKAGAIATCLQAGLANALVIDREIAERVLHG